MNYVPLHVHTCWSLLDSTLDVTEYVSFVKENGGKACAITDHNNIKGLVPFYKACKNKGVKPIFGVELDVWHNEKFIGRITLLAKNKLGYKNLLTIVSIARSKDRLSSDGMAKSYLNELHQYSSGLICLIGDLKSEVFESSYVNPEMAYLSDSEEECRTLLKKDLISVVSSVLSKYSKVFKDVFLYFDYSKLPCLKILGAEIKKSFPEAIPCNNVHYLSQKDFDIHRLIINDSERSEMLVDDKRIFDDRFNFCHVMKDMPEGEKTFKIAEMIEDFSIEERPMLPEFKIKDHAIPDQDEYLKGICRKGFSEKILPKIDSNKSLREVYLNRIKHELEVFKQAKISGYFLIVKDIVDFVRGLGYPADSRGSSSGSIISYLIGVSSIDPIVPDPTLAYSSDRELPFERFYNEGRNTASNVSLPDIDMDLPPSVRSEVIEYIREKYGFDSVAHIITHSRFKGKGAIKEAFRILKPVSNYFDVANEITKLFAEEAKISDELSEIQEEDPSYGIIKWNIDNIKDVAKYYEQYKEAFDFALRIERLPKNESVHAAGIIISDKMLSNHFPMTYSSKLDQMVIDVEGADIETLGGAKFDILGVSALEKIFQIEKMLNFKLNEIRFGVLANVN
jgi:DNA polymerase-3 subunit alpha